MKTTIQETDSGFITELIPETMEDQNILVRMSQGSRKQTTQIETIFYRGNTTIAYIQTKKFKNKSYGTVK